MNLLFWKNLFGYDISDYELKDVPYPRAELNFHVLVKTIKTFTLFGSLAVGPAMALIFGPRTSNQLLIKMIQWGRLGALAAVPTAPVVTNGFLLYKDVDLKNIELRCYQLRKNKKEKIVDQYFFLGSAVLTPLLGWTGFIISTNNAILFGNIFNRFGPKYKD